MRKSLLGMLLLALMASGCATRSISDSEYGGGYYGYGGHNPLYKGEMSEFDVLGIDAGKEISEQDIANAAAEEKTPITLSKGSHLMVIQSGALMPDEEMTKDLEKYFSITPFTGIPEKSKEENASYAKALRLAAAKAGLDKMFVYWGVLESGTRNLATKSVSWVPIVGNAVPDQTQELRIRLKVALIDVKTGQWEMFTPEVFKDKAISASVTREQSDQAQVAQLKSQAYQAAVESTVARYVR